MKQYKNLIIGLIALPILQYLIDLLYVYIYPNISPLRALMISITAFVVLLIALAFHRKEINPVVGGLSILSSAFFGSLLVNGGFLVSKSVGSGIWHIIILEFSFLVLYFIYEYWKRR